MQDVQICGSCADQLGFPFSLQLIQGHQVVTHYKEINECHPTFLLVLGFGCVCPVGLDIQAPESIQDDVRVT